MVTYTIITYTMKSDMTNCAYNIKEFSIFKKYVDTWIHYALENMQ